ncbi:MAG: hypothetical protein JWQ11_1852 [Rhizobacter sp.]|nr:hypothetical protein [Rhizobacter sp.]
MQDRPDPIELLEAVTRFLRETAIPQLQGHAAYHARVSATALDIVRRQLLLAEPANTLEMQRLQALLAEADGGQDEPDLDSLNRDLCTRIATGRLDLATPGLAEHLWQVTLDKLAVDQPQYSSFVRQTGARPAANDADAAPVHTSR